MIKRESTRVCFDSGERLGVGGRGGWWRERKGEGEGERKEAARRKRDGSFSSFLHGQLIHMDNWST